MSRPVAENDVAAAAASPRAADGRSRRWEAHRAERRDELTLAARRAIHHGGPELSMDEIATAIGTSKSIVYRYFSDRTGLQTAVGEAVLRDMGAALAEASRLARDPHEVVRAMVGVYLEMVSTSPSVYAFVTRGDLGVTTAPLRTLADDAAALLTPVLRQVLADSGRDPDAADLWAAGVIGFVRGAADVWLADTDRPVPARPGEDADPATAALADTLADWICDGTRADRSGTDAPRTASPPTSVAPGHP